MQNVPPQIDRGSRRRFLRQTAGAAAAGSMAGSLSAARSPTTLRFGLNADPHLMARRTPANEANFLRFVEQMEQWKPQFAIDLGDFGCQAGEGQTTRQLHDAQHAALAHHVRVFAKLSCPRYHVIGNHDVGWLRGGEEHIAPDDLIGRGHAGEDITKQEFLTATRTPHRHYAFDAGRFHCIVLDGNNAPEEGADRGRDGVVGAYWIDAVQRAWLADDLAANRPKPKLVFCHEELHHTPVAGSEQGGDRPFPPVGKQGSYIDNGWQIRKQLADDGRVIACFFGHKHRNRWTVYDRTHYITMAATHWRASYATVEISDHLRITGFGGQRSYQLPLLTQQT